MNSNLTLITDGNNYNVNSFEDIINILLGSNYNLLTKTEQMNIKKKNIALLLRQYNINNISDYMYILLLIKSNNIIVIENRESNIFKKYLNINNKEILIINYFIEEIINNYMRNQNG